MNDRKFGWDLPPGVTEGMIPGNRPEDILFERILDDVFTHGELGREPIEEIAAEVLARYADEYGNEPFEVCEIVEAFEDDQ